MITLDSIKSTEIEEMRLWLKECYEDEYDQELIDQSSDSNIVRHIERDFDGGVEGFVRTL